MKPTTLIVLTLAASIAARADFSYSTARKGTATTGGPESTKQFLKGQKMKTDSGATAIIMDFDAQTMTHVDNTKKTYTVTKFSEVGATLQKTGVEPKIDIKETGQKKTINGYSASEVLMNVEVDAPPTAMAGGKMQMEVEMWLSSDVPGAKEMRAFYQKNAANLPWAAINGGGNNPMQKAMADMQRKIANIGGVPVLQVIKMKSGGNEQQKADMQDKMTKARAQLEAMAARGGPQADMAKQALSRMGPAAGGGSLFEITMESTGFSAAPIPDSVFAIPAGYTKVERPSAPGR